MSRRQPTSTPRVSVVIPSYNHERYIEAAVSSVLEQDADLELVVIDDGSTDTSRQRLEAIGDPRLRLTCQDNQGAHVALNRGIEQCRGELVFLLNSDDRFHARRIGRCLEVFDGSPDVDLLTTWIEIIDGQDQPVGIKEGWRNMPPWPRPRPGKGLSDTGEPALALLEANYVATTSNVAFRRAWWQGAGLRFAPLRYTHDWEMLLAAACHGTLDLLDEPLVSYRVHADNTLKEGQARPSHQDPWQRGEGAMRFEILWTVARHAHPLCHRFANPPRTTLEDLTARAWRSLPRFGHDDLLAVMLQLRGDGTRPAEGFEALLDPRHPLRRHMIQRLAP